MSPRNILVTDPFLVKRPKNRKKKYAGPFSEILVLVVADGRGAGLSGGSEYLKTALILNQHAFIKFRLCHFNFDTKQAPWHDTRKENCYIITKSIHTINKIKIKMLSRRRIELTPTDVEAGIQ